MVFNAETVKTDRVRKIKIAGYDQVFALTQWIVNNGLEQNWLELMASGDPDLMADLSFSQPGAGEIYGAKVGAPRIVVQTGYAEDLSGVIYLMCFDAGTFELTHNALGEDGKPKKNKKGKVETITKEYDMAGWRIAFSMQLGMTLVERSSDKFKKLGIKAGEYSLNELQAKFETAEFEPKDCIFGEFTWDEFSKPEKDSFDFVISHLKRELLDVLKAKCSTVGFCLKEDGAAPQSSKPEMTFKPNEIQYQTYPWVDPGAANFQPSSGIKGNQRLNYLLYCETTGNRKLPPIDQRFLPRNGNWTDGRLDNLPDEAQPESTEFGAFHMARRNFFDGYLLKKLRQLNHILNPSLSFAYVKVDDWSNPWCAWNCDLTIGDLRGRSKDDSFYDFKLIEGSSPPKWEFKNSITSKQGYDESGLDGWSAKVWGDASCETRNTVSFEPGSDLVTVEGTSTVYFKFRYWEYKALKKNIDRTENVQWTVKWKMLLDLEAVDDGGLQIKSVFEGPTVSMKEEGISTLGGYCDYTKKAFTSAISNMSGLQKELAEDLAGKQGLVLPAGGVFFFKNPILGHDGDLVCSIAYSKIQPKVMFNPEDHTAINDDANKRATYNVGSEQPLPPPATGGSIPL
ncbi:hypothetical protein G7Z17_g513 [Cylindrodendrum hubeiense]|uniref:Uncharacterized protein n=1 Tax=Cylindrodendrum hubeiense TaxID=595255 RepID=A0A9P5HN06_9HYPO|nr:hypothetical protein G7Z17_g513 [Cylindrodendrum hubeiense]